MRIFAIRWAFARASVIARDRPRVWPSVSDPEKEAHLDFVASLTVPEEIVAGTAQRYLDIFETLTGETLGNYQQKWLVPVE